MHNPYRFLFLFILAAGGFNAYAQVKAKNIWPVVGEISTKNFHLNARASEGYIADQFIFSGCVDGNCKNGEGVWASTFSRNVGFSTNGSLELTVNIYKGRFSEDGKKFNGKKLVYNYTLSGSGAKNRDFYANKFTPLQTVNLSEDISKPIMASNYIVAEGEAVRTESRYGKEIIYSYTLHGIGADRAAMLELGAAAMQGKYENGQLQLLRADIKETFPAKTFTGRMNFKNKPLVGKLEFRDGTYYEGFFYDNSYNGPGRLVSADGKVLQGFWEKGILADSQEVTLPGFLWNYTVTPGAASKPYTLTIGDKSYTGEYTGDWKEGKPYGNGFFSVLPDIFYYGGFENGVAGGLGYFYRLYKTDNWACCERKSEDVLSGLFNKGWLVNGNFSNTGYMKYSSASDPNHLRGFIKTQSYESTGSFINHKLNGCGRVIDRRWETEIDLSKTMTGTFKDGGLHGWAMVDYPYKKQDKEWTGKYAGYFVYHPVSPYAKRQDLLARLYEPHGGDVVKHYTDFERDVAIFLKAVAAGQDGCSNGFISEADKKKYTEEAKSRGLYARKMATDYLNRPPAPTFVSNYDNSVKQIKYRTGTTLLNNGITSVITGYDFNNSKYEVSTPVYKSVYGMGGRFKGLKDGVERNWLTETEVENRFKVQTRVYSICSVCNGNGSTTGTVHGGNKGGWEKWTDNVFYNRPSTAYSYEVTTGCGECRMIGWR
jgi:hypothetical protein